jgi:hypothetical protein
LYKCQEYVIVKKNFCPERAIQEKNMSLKPEKEKIKKDIAGILEKIRSEADPGILNEYRAIFRKEVSLFNRSYAAAYLLMLYGQGEIGGRDFRQHTAREDAGGRRSGRRKNREERTAERRNSPGGEEHSPAGSRNDENPYPLAEEDSKYLFISIGRNRRVFPREILGLINAKTSIPREDIGAIRILDKYSFVQVRDSRADTIIEALNGQPFRGRTLSVNYAYARDPEEKRGEDPVTDNEDGEERISESGLEENNDHPDEEHV